MTLIKGGTIVDGTGKPAFVGDVLVDGDKVVDVGSLGSIESVGLKTQETLSDPDPETIDASGLIVSPGFIDAHTHSDAYLVIEPDAPSKVSQGITTELNGQCGGSIAPRYGEARLSSDWAAILGERKARLAVTRSALRGEARREHGPVHRTQHAPLVRRRVWGDGVLTVADEGDVPSS